jgi:AraC-like DNA-binding protein
LILTDAADCEPTGATYRSFVAPYLSELTETRRVLERSECRRWWEVATLELYGQPSKLVIGPADDGGTESMREHDRMALIQCPSDMQRYAAHDQESPSQTSRSVTLSLDFSHRKLGELRLRLLPHVSLHDVNASALTALASQCACTIQRLASQRRLMHAQWGAPCLIGSSPALLTLDGQIEACCADAHPVVLFGPRGNEALQTAVAIHHGSVEAGQAFVQVDCTTTLEPPWRWVDRARGGTLFLCNPDCGTVADQEHLWHQLELALAYPTEWPDDKATRQQLTTQAYRKSCRLVLALKAPTPSNSISCPVPYGAWRQRTWNVIHLPPLSERIEDIPVLARAVLDYHGHSAEHRMTDSLQHWCSHYTWPGNASQLEWTVARMAVLTANMAIGASDISLLSPRLLGDAAAIYTPQEPHGPNAVNGDVPHQPTQPANPTVSSIRPVEHWVHCVLEHDTQAFAHLHAGLARALQYLCKQFHESISAEQLADQAHVSASHLRFLFRDSLGLSFKLFLQQVRIAHAKRLLLNSPQRRITDVALSVGFSDFSHFQKCFRQIVGQTPSELRRTQALVLLPLQAQADMS